MQKSSSAMSAHNFSQFAGQRVTILNLHTRVFRKQQNFKNHWPCLKYHGRTNEVPPSSAHLQDRQAKQPGQLPPYKTVTIAN